MGGADDAGGDGLADAEGVADGEDDVTDAAGFGVAEGDDRWFIDTDLQDGEVGIRVGADEFGLGDATIGQGDLDFIGALDDVVIGQDIALWIDDDAGAEAGLHPFAGHTEAITEELFKYRIIHQGVGAFYYPGEGEDIDHRRLGCCDGIGIRGDELLTGGPLFMLGFFEFEAIRPIIQQARKEIENDKGRRQPEGGKLENEAECLIDTHSLKLSLH